jgi:hypothetical protein
MGIPDADISLLWGKAAGHCSFPGCNEDCSIYLKKTGHTTIGEMAHVIARSTSGPRGGTSAGEDKYENLILLCPNHHTTVDKAPDDFPVEMLLRWKTEHEERTRVALEAPALSTQSELYAYARRLLSQNGLIHRQFGPESEGAKDNPLSEGAALWELRKCDTIIPNNSRLLSAFERNSAAVPAQDWGAFEEFREHAFAFEQNAYRRLDRKMVPRFPKKFAEILREQ